MTAKDDLVRKLWRGADPFQGMPNLYATDMQGWNSHHPFLREAIDQAKPRIIVEVGVWKGGSVVTMAEHVRSLGLDCAVIAVDTWLGSAEHWNMDEWRADLKLLNGYPHIFRTFMANVMSKNLQDFVVPLPIDSVNAYHILKSNQVTPDMVHIDAGHDYISVKNDLTAWWSILPVGGILVGDDYFADGSMWPEVRAAIDDFLAEKPHRDFRHGDGKCLVVKA